MEYLFHFLSIFGWRLVGHHGLLHFDWWDDGRCLLDVGLVLWMGVVVWPALVHLGLR